MTKFHRTCSRLASGGQRTVPVQNRQPAVVFDPSGPYGCGFIVGPSTILRLLFFLALLLLHGCGAKDAGTGTETAAVAPVKAEPSAAEIPLVTLHTATTGRLPLRRRATGKLRARREVIVKSRAGGEVTAAPLPAPFSGRAADVKVQAGGRVGPGEEVCTLTDPNSLEVEFSLLESELAALSDKTKVWVTLPNSSSSPQGEGSGTPPLAAGGLILNPKVGPGGLLRARARLRNYGKARLYPGMNVDVTLETRAPSAVLLPKSAVVERSSRTLVFAYDAESSRAKWLYVTVGYENDELVAVTEGVEAGQEIIVAGGFTLDHDSRVRVGE